MRPWTSPIGPRGYVIPAVLALAALTLASSARAAEGPPGPARRPNLVLVITDDQGYGDLGALGNRMIRTPNLDRLHAQSVRLTDFHVDPTCSPTRAALLTGRYSTRTGAWHTIAGRSLMRPEERTLAESLASVGYRTGLFGKWHLGDNAPLRPQDQGFHEVLTHGGGGVGQTPDHWGNDYFDDVYLRNGQPTRFRGYCTDVWFDNALRFIEDNRDRPFFAYIAPNAPHAPYNVAESYARPYLDAGVPQPMANFYGMISCIDENVGRLLARLDELGLNHNTILVFLTDNGTAAGVARNQQADGWTGFNAGMRGQKGSQYDGGHRVPCFVRYPAGGIGGGRDVETLTAHIDLLPTLLDFCGVERPEGPPLDGRSLVPLLTGEPATSWPDRTLFVHSQRIETPEKWRQSAVLTGRWRLINGRELYDIQADPGQTRDIAESHDAVVDELRRAYDAWWTSLSERFDESVPIAVGLPGTGPTLLTCHDWHPTAGDVPWNQEMIARVPESNGFWVLDVTRGGRYRITLRQAPAAVARPIAAWQARVQIDGAEISGPVPEGAASVSFTLDLEPGPARLTTTLTDALGRSRGAFFVEIERQGDAAQ